MYDRFYNFHTLPFENTPDPRFFYASEQHREALAAIEYTIRQRKGIALVTGEVGSGKTTVGRIMLERCGSRATVVRLLHGHQSGIELTRHVIRTLRLPTPAAADRAEMFDRLEAYLRDQAQQGRPVVLFVDEAQTLSDEALEELRLMSNFDTNTSKLLQLVLIGQPELRQRIGEPAMNPLRQRIVMNRQLPPLDIRDVAGYIAHRTRAASQDPEAVRVSFAGEAIEQIYRFSDGVPRLINVVCDNALLLGFVKEAPRITGPMVSQVIGDMVPRFNSHLGADTGAEAPLSLARNY